MSKCLVVAGTEAPSPVGERQPCPGLSTSQSLDYSISHYDTSVWCLYRTHDSKIFSVRHTSPTSSQYGARRRVGSLTTVSSCHWSSSPRSTLLSGQCERTEASSLRQSL